MQYHYSNELQLCILALFRWKCWIPAGESLDYFLPLIDKLGLEVERTISTKFQLYASDSPTAAVDQISQVSVLILRCSCNSSDVTIELRSGEPMLRKNTRCESKAKALQKALDEIQLSE